MKIILTVWRMLCPPHTGRRVADTPPHAGPTASPGRPAAQSGESRRGAPLVVRAGASGRKRIRPFLLGLPAGMPAAQPIDPCEDSPVRPYVLLWERHREAQRADATRLGIAVLADIATAGVTR